MVAQDVFHVLPKVFELLFGAPDDVDKVLVEVLAVGEHSELQRLGWEAFEQVVLVAAVVVNQCVVLQELVVLVELLLGSYAFKTLKERLVGAAQKVTEPALAGLSYHAQVAIAFAHEFVELEELVEIACSHLVADHPDVHVGLVVLLLKRLQGLLEDRQQPNFLQEAEHVQMLRTAAYLGELAVLHDLTQPHEEGAGPV